MVLSRREFLAASAAAAFSPKLAWAQQPVQFEGDAVFMRVLQKALDAGWAKLPMGEIVGRVGLELIGTPYVGWTLERDVRQEFCFVTLDGLDCVTLFESSLGFARMLKRWQRDVASKAAPNVRIRRPLPSDLVVEVTKTRYRGGVVDGYLSRLHYTCDWIFDNARKGTVRDLAAQFEAGTPLGKRIHFMSSNAKVYRQLEADPNLIPELKKIEDAISKRTNAFVPAKAVKGIESKLKTGDIIGLTTTQDGMDCAHTGLIVRRDGESRFLHASSTAKKVVLDSVISEVVAANKRYTGIMIARPLELP